MDNCIWKDSHSTVEKMCVEKPQRIVAGIVVMAGTHTYIYTRLLSKWKQACCSNRSNLSPSAGAQRRDITNCGLTAHTQAYWCIYVQKTPTYPQSHPSLHKLIFSQPLSKTKKRKKKHLDPIRNSSNPTITQNPFRNYPSNQYFCLVFWYKLHYLKLILKCMNVSPITYLGL